MSQRAVSQPNIAVIMAGGRGTRFWPRSRTLRPKQFLAMVGERTLLNQTVDRLRPLFQLDDIYVVTTADLAEATRRLLPELPPHNVIVEPEGRNTGPCLALALVEIERRTSQGVMAVLSADHWIADAEAFRADLVTALDHARATGALVTFGIRPTHPETGYGYIETEGEGAVRRVRAFREKPPLETALTYVASGRHFWNAGMFVWTLEGFRTELQRHAPELLEPLDGWVRAGAWPAELPSAYGRLPKISIDYALMERSDRVAVVPAHFPWSDVGSWPAAASFLERDEHGNVVRGDGILVDSRHCTIFGGSRYVAGVGLTDLIIVDEPDALLICHREHAQGVRAVVDHLQASGRLDLL